MATIEKQLREAARSSGLSIRQISLRAGIQYATAHGFIVDERGATLATANKLAKLLEMELRPMRRRRRKG